MMRFLDVWLGRPLCALFTLVRACARVCGLERGAPGSPRSILLLKLTEQGATVLAWNAIARAREMVGAENVYLCVLEDNREILDLLGTIPTQNVFAIRSRSLLVFSLDVLRMLRRARGLRIDATVDMEFFARFPAVLAYLTGARRRVGVHRFTAELPYRGDLLTHRVPYNPYVSTATAYRMLVEAVVLNQDETPFLKTPLTQVTDAPPPFEPSEPERERVRELARRAAGRELTHPIIILNPNASDIIPLRKWPTERFVELGRRLAEANPRVSLVITGSPAEEEAGARIARDIGEDRAVSLAGLTSLRELVVLYTLADVLVTNDSGPGHFASLTGIDAVVLFGPETPVLYGPLGPRAHVIWAGLACSPCVSAFNHRLSPCADNVCMKSITTEQVFEKVMEVLERRKT